MRRLKDWQWIAVALAGLVGATLAWVWWVTP